MLSPLSDDYLTNYDWFRAYVEAEDQPVILCHTSAMECLEYFPGYGHEKEIDVFATRKGKFENVHYHIIDDLSKKETVQFGNVTCTTLNQTVNDMLDGYNTMDEQALIEGLAYYVHYHDSTWQNITVKPVHENRFKDIQQWASEHFGGGY
jgi:hypothetical protein